MDRKQVEKRIIQILDYVEHPVTESLKENFEIFSLEELLEIQKFLETWDLNPIQQFLFKKVSEYKQTLGTIKLKRAKHKVNKHKLTEAKERVQEEAEAENMITFS